LTQLSSRRALSRERTASPSAFSMRSRIDLDLVADLEVAFAAGARIPSSATRPFGLQADVDDGDVLLDGDDSMPLTTEPSSASRRASVPLPDAAGPSSGGSVER
jgi:hypothetical protein